MITIRHAKENDLPAIQGLLGELDYPLEAPALQPGLEKLCASRDDRVFLAERDGAVVGLVAAHCIPLLYSPAPLGRITGAVVTETARGNGIGAALVKKAEAFFQAQGCTRIEVMSRDYRASAHRFYEGLGYHCDERRFLKRLNP